MRRSVIAVSVLALIGCRTDRILRTTAAILGATLFVGCTGRENTTGSLDPDDPGVIVFSINTFDDLRSIRPDGTGL